MQLKIRRSQRDGGVISKHAVFMLDARVQLTQEEHRHIDRYKLWNEHIYSSESAHKSWAKAEVAADGSTGGGLKSLAHSIAAAFKLNVTIRSIHSGQHIECKSLEELLFAEECIKTACKNLQEYLAVAATFNGSEILIDYSTDEPEIVARSIVPQPALITDSATMEMTRPVTEPEVQPSEQRDSNYEEAVYEPLPPEAPAAAGTYDQHDGAPAQPLLEPEAAKMLVATGLVVALLVFFFGISGMYLLKFIVVIGLAVSAPTLIKKFNSL